MVSSNILHCDFDFFPFYSTLLIGNTKKSKRIGSKYFLLMSLLQLQRALCAILSSIIWQRLLLLSKEFFIRRLSKNGESSTSPQCYKASKFSLHIKTKMAQKTEKRGARKPRALHSFLFPQKHQCCLSCMPLFVFPLLYCIKCQALKMEVEIRDAAADLKAYKYRRRSSFPYPKRVKKGSLPLLLYTTT